MLGSLKVFGNKRYITATHIKPYKGEDELFFHILEAATVTLTFERGPVRTSLKQYSETDIDMILHLASPAKRRCTRPHEQSEHCRRGTVRIHRAIFHHRGLHGAIRTLRAAAARNHAIYHLATQKRRGCPRSGDRQTCRYLGARSRKRALDQVFTAVHVLRPNLAHTIFLQPSLGSSHGPRSRIQHDRRFSFQRVRVNQLWS